MVNNISVVMIVKNGAKTIKMSLDSLKGFDDVVVYDNGSLDETVTIACSYANVNLINGEFLGFGDTKNLAASYAKYDWILILDSDEVVDNELFEALQCKILDENSVYLLNFKAFYKDIQVKHCGWNNQKIGRLYNKKITKFNSSHVHENIITKNMNIVKFNHGNVLHYSYHSITDFIIKTDRYSTIFAIDNKGKKKSSPFKAFYRALFHFVKIYFFRLGFLDGYVGLLISVSGANGVFFKYLKLYEENNK